MHTRHLDKAGIAASLLCAVHCSVLPILLSAGVWTSGSWFSSDGVDILLALAAAVLAFFSYRRSIRHHHQRGPIRLAILGFTLVGIGLFLVHGSLWEIALMTLGGISIAVSHVWNLKLSYRCVSCSHS